MHLSELKQKPITELLELAAANGIDNANPTVFASRN